MKFIYILLSCCAFSLNKGLITSKKTEMNWYEAQENCRQKGGILPDSDDITNSLRWAGKYRRISLLIKILGCYNDSFVQSTIPTNAYKMKTPSAGYCQEICLSFDSFVFAIKDNECRCLEEIPQKGNASTSLCNDTSCERDEEPYFDDCGGKETYSVFQSDPKNEKATDVNTSGCLAVQCSVPPNFTFYYEEDCSLLYKPFCDMTVSNTSATWMESMRICRSTLSLPVLTEEIFLHDINKTCKAIGENRTERYWLGVAKEKYIGFDKEDTVINNQDKVFFIDCFICDRTAKSNNDCYVISCEEQLNVTGLCSEIKQAKTTVIGRTTNETNMPETGTWQITTVADISLVITGTQGITKNTKISKKEVLQIVIYLVDAVLLGGIIFTLRLIYLRKKKIKKKQKMKPNQSLRNAGYSDVEISTDVDLQEVTGIVNHNYFVLELQEQPLQSTDTTINKETESPYVDTKDGIYDHLREHREKKVNEKNTSDEANKSISISDYPYTECVEVYDQLRDKIVSMEDYTEDIHNHVFATTSTASVHATADRCNQYKMHSTFDKVSNIRPDATYINLPHENGNNISERLDEDHPYFILTPQTNIIIKYVEKNH